MVRPPAGIALKRTAKPAAIASALRRLLDEPAYRDNAARLGAIIRSDAASGALVSELEAVAAPVAA
jgi:UDP:flavonoid glycosyltransferase YjiC (YdhE family)